MCGHMCARVRLCACMCLCACTRMCVCAHMTECMLAHVLMPVCIHVLGQTELEERPGEQTEWVVFPNMGGVSALTLAQPYWVGGHYWLYLKPGFPFTHCRQSIKISPAGSFPKGGGPSLSREILHLRKNKSPGGAEVGFSHHWGLVPREEECRAVVGKPGKGNVDVAPPSDVGGGGPKDGEVLFWPSCLQIPPVRSALPTPRLPRPPPQPCSASCRSHWAPCPFLKQPDFLATKNNNIWYQASESFGWGHVSKFLTRELLNENSYFFFFQSGYFFPLFFFLLLKMLGEPQPRNQCLMGHRV